MPEQPWPKAKAHPWRELANSPPPQGPLRAAGCDYAELQVTSNFTFLTGASHPDELVQQAGLLGHRAIAITDTNSLAGIVRAHVAAKEMGVRLVVGARIVLSDEATKRRSDEGEASFDPSSLHRSVAPSLLLYPASLRGYGNLCKLLTTGKRRAPKGECHLMLHDVLERHEDLLAAVIAPDYVDEPCLHALMTLRDTFNDDRMSIVMSRRFEQDDDERLERLAILSEHLRVPLVATNDVHYHEPSRRALQDVLTCIRHGCTLAEAGMLLHANAERHLKPPEEMARLFAEYPQAVARTMQIVERTAGFSLDQVRYQYPDEVVPAGKTPMQYLTELTWQGATEVYSDEAIERRSDEGQLHPSSLRRSVAPSLPASVHTQIEHELKLIADLNYAPYFLTVYDLVKYARSQGILCQGRGAAANSAVCFCLGITSVDPARIDLLFERFISKERDEPPDIDIDFEHERREEVIQYIYRKYGRHRAALCAEVVSYRTRSAIRDVGKALGLSLDMVDRLAKSVDWWAGEDVDVQQIQDLGINPEDVTIGRLRMLALELQGFPRHLGQHVGGFVIANQPLEELVPIENAAMEDRTVIEWDKDDVDAMGMIKVDCLGLGMLTVLSKGLALLNGGRGTHEKHDLLLRDIPAEDPIVYDMICKADTIGVFQIESRAQMSMLPRLKPRKFYDLVIEVAIVRPGPIQGDMVHPYLRRRNGEEPVIYPDERIRQVLGKTLGVPLFQEQAMRIAIVAANFTPGEADQLRRAINAWKTRGNKIEYFRKRIVEGMVENGYTAEFAEQCFAQIQGFSGYGFPESHAASFALLVYASAWLKCHHPAAFAAALLNSQPMGFYAPAQIVRDAQNHGVEARAVDVNRSAWDCTLEEGMEARRHEGTEGNGLSFVPSCLRAFVPALRLGFRQIRGLRQEEGERIADAVKRCGHFDSIAALWRESGVMVATLRRLASADAFASMGLDRQRALWEVRKLRDERLPLFESEQATERRSDEGDADVERGSPVSLRRPPRRIAPSLPRVPEYRKVIQDYHATGLSLRRHPVAFIREWLDERHVTEAGQLSDEDLWRHGRRITVAGVCLLRQRPGTAGGITFMTLEDETGVANIVVHQRTWDANRKAARDGGAMIVQGHVERQGQVVHVVARRITAIDHKLRDLLVRPRNFR